MHSIQLRHIESDDDLRHSYPVMRELRPALEGADEFVRRVGRQREEGYRLLAAYEGTGILGLAGYRITEKLVYGRFLYVDDLVVTEMARGRRIGEALLAELREEARREGCASLVLDTGMANTLGQRFYFRQGMLPRGLHFSQPIPAG